MQLSSRMRFFIKLILRGFIWLLLILAFYLLFRKVIFTHNFSEVIEPFYAQPLVVYGIYFTSELIMGIIPPELFMLWAVNKGNLTVYMANVGFFASVSYFLGYVTFLAGHFVKKRYSDWTFRFKKLNSIWSQFKKYGIFMVILAAITPIPWSAISFLVGTTGLKGRVFLRYGLFRFVRFGVYGYIIYKTHLI